MEVAFRSSNSVFLNSDVLFIEYHDVLKAPWLLTLAIIDDIDEIKNLYNTELMNLINESSRGKWYTERKYRSILKSIGAKSEELTDDDHWGYLNAVMQAIPDVYGEQSELTMMNVLRRLPPDKNHEFIKKIYIYTDVYEEAVENDLFMSNLPNHEYIYGKSHHLKSFKDVLDEYKINTNVTYILSDIDKLIVLNETNRLRFSSVILADNFSYNKNEDGTFRLPIEELIEKNSPMIFNVFDVTG